MSAPRPPVLVLLFGGQSSRDEGMFDRLEAADPEVGARARVQATQHGPGDPIDFSSNRAIQVSVLAVMLGWLDVVRRRGLESGASAGLSLGEYAHLVDIGMLEQEDALDLVAQRGALYDQGPDGCMAAFFPVAWEELEPLVERVADARGGPEALAPAVFNSPTQTVVAGERSAVRELMRLADEELSAWSTLVEERVPMHTPRFATVAAPFREALEGAPWSGEARLPYRPNVTAERTDATPTVVVDRLTRHVYEPVRWRQTVDALAGEHPGAVFLEPGPRTVVRDLLRRRWHPELHTLALDPGDEDGRSVEAHVEATLEEVARALG